MKKCFLFAMFPFFVLAQPCMGDKRVINGVAVYDRPPSAYELAKSLFPPKNRSVILNAERLKPIVPAVKSVAFMINFEYDSVNVTKDSRPYLDALGDMLNFKQLKRESLMIEGHADASGDDQYNLKLSESRAETIKNYLVSVHRIDPNRLSITGYGETRLLDRKHPADQINRRAEFKPRDKAP